MQFPFAGGLADPAVNGDMVSLETHAFVQVIYCGDHGMHINISACAMSFVNVYNRFASFSFFPLNLVCLFVFFFSLQI